MQSARLGARSAGSDAPCQEMTPTVGAAGVGFNKVVSEVRPPTPAMLEGGCLQTVKAGWLGPRIC